jgi:hypothetical protein
MKRNTRSKTVTAFPKIDLKQSIKKLYARSISHFSIKDSHAFMTPGIPWPAKAS